MDIEAAGVISIIIKKVRKIMRKIMRKMQKYSGRIL